MLIQPGGFCLSLGPALALGGAAQPVIDRSMQQVVLLVLAVLVGVFGYLIVVRVASLDLGTEEGPDPTDAPAKTDPAETGRDGVPNWNAGETGRSDTTGCDD